MFYWTIPTTIIPRCTTCQSGSEHNTIEMKISSIALALLVTVASASTIPQAASSKNLEARQQTGSYTISGLGSRKRQVTTAGASSLNLAIAMLETERMDTNVRTHLWPNHSRGLR